MARRWLQATASAGPDIDAPSTLTIPATPDWPSIDAWIAREHPRVAHWDVPTLVRRLDEAAGSPRSVPLLIDVRADAEFRVSRLPGAVHAPTLGAVVGLAATRPPGTTMVLYCSVGVRSTRLADALATRGLDDVVNLRGSIFDWANRGLPLVGARGPVDRVHPFDARWAVLLDPSRREPPRGATVRSGEPLNPA